MRKPKKEIQLTSYDELLGINEAEQNTLNQIVEVPLNELHPFRNHPFHVNDDEKMAETVESIKNYGILNPALVRPRAEGGYELIAGHRRKRGCELAGKSKMPVLIRNYTDDEAVIVMVDSNIQRENLLPSEKAYAYKMKMDAVKHQGIKDENAVSVDSADLVGQAAGDSGRTVQRYIRLTCLIPENAKGMMREVCDAGGAIFFSTHVLEVAEKLCDKVAIIKSGKLIRSGIMDDEIQVDYLEKTEEENSESSSENEDYP